MGRIGRLRKILMDDGGRDQAQMSSASYDGDNLVTLCRQTGRNGRADEAGRPYD
jgi:hypothetical protein